MGLKRTSIGAGVAVTGPTRSLIGIAVVGDSISSYETTTGRAWHKQLGHLSQQKILWRGFSAAGGYTLEQIETLLLPTILAIDPRPQICIIAGGTNNVGAGGYSETTTRATHGRIRAALEAVGIIPGLWALPPRDDSTTINGHVDRWNAWIYRLALQYGYPLIDAHAALVNPATGLYQTALQLDTIHPNSVGHLAIAQKVLADDAFSEHVADFNPDFATSAIDTANVALPGLFVGDANADGLADGWSGFGTYTKSLVAAPYGNWQRISLLSGVASGGGAWRQDFAVTAGRRYAFAAKAHVDLDPAVPNLRFVISLEWRTAGGSVSFDWFLDGAPLLNTYVASYRELVAPATATLVRITGILQTGTPTRDIYGEASQVTVRDVTSIGT